MAPRQQAPLQSPSPARSRWRPMSSAESLNWSLHRAQGQGDKCCSRYQRRSMQAARTCCVRASSCKRCACLQVFYAHQFAQFAQHARHTSHAQPHMPPHQAISIQLLFCGHSSWCGRCLPRPRSAIRSTSVSGRSGYWGPFCCCFWLGEAPFLAGAAPFFATPPEDGACSASIIFKGT